MGNIWLKHLLDKILHILVGSSSCQSSGSISVGGSCFVVRETTLDWFTARSRCRATDDGDLASFDGSFNSFNSQWPTNGQNYWVGLRQYSWNWNDTSKFDIYPECQVLLRAPLAARPTRANDIVLKVAARKLEIILVQDSVAHRKAYRSFRMGSW